MREELLKGLTEEQIAKVKACKSQEEVLKVAKEEGVELTDEQLEVVSGGGSCSSRRYTCDRCGSDLTSRFEYGTGKHEGWHHVRCNKCGNTWWAEI